MTLPLSYSSHWEKKRSHLVHGAAQLSRRHADDDSSRLQSGDLLFGTPFASGNDGSCVPHSPSRRGRQASNEWHHWLSIGTLKKNKRKKNNDKLKDFEINTHFLFWAKLIFIYSKDALTMCQVTTLKSDKDSKLTVMTFTLLQNVSISNDCFWSFYSKNIVKRCCLCDIKHHK